jgi:hypothetical protein
MVPRFGGASCRRDRHDDVDLVVALQGAAPASAAASIASDLASGSFGAFPGSGG